MVDAPHAGARIEIEYVGTHETLMPDAPHAGARIEINDGETFTAYYNWTPPTRGRELKYSRAR